MAEEDAATSHEFLSCCNPDQFTSQKLCSQFQAHYSAITVELGGLRKYLFCFLLLCIALPTVAHKEYRRPFLKQIGVWLVGVSASCSASQASDLKVAKCLVRLQGVCFSKGPPFLLKYLALSQRDAGRRWPISKDRAGDADKNDRGFGVNLSHLAPSLAPKDLRNKPKRKGQRRSLEAAYPVHIQPEGCAPHEKKLWTLLSGTTG